MNESKITVGGITVDAKRTPCGEIASKRTRYRATPYKGSKYVIYKVPPHIKYSNNEVQTP